MSKFLRVLGTAFIGIVLVGSTWYVLTSHEIASDPNWPKNIHRRLGGLGTSITVYDADSKTPLFTYSSDPSAYPVRIDRQDENHWTVVFEKRK